MPRFGPRSAFTLSETILERVDVQAGVGLVHQGDFWLKQGHLKNLGAFLLATGEAVVDGAVDEAVVYFEQAHFLLQQLAELTGGMDLRLPILPVGFSPSSSGFVAFAHGFERAAQEVGHAHAGDSHGVLEGEEEAHTSAAVGRIFQDILTLEPDFTLGHFVFRVAHNDICQCAFARAIWSH